jgi:(p)ppGpp synthase/HD superfamily hydrolase
MNEQELLEKDRYGAPYILHPLRVMDRLDTTTEKIVGVLHDVVEDTAWTFEELARQGFPPAVLEALRCVTKKEGEDYEDFVRRSASNSLARRIKLADLQDNMDLRRMSGLTENDIPRLQKYLNAWTLLRT